MRISTKVPALVHACAAAWLAGMALYGLLAPERYELSMQEDRPIEWATVWLFLFAGGAGIANAFRRRRPFDGLVALFCLFVAGEEFSWGQRLFGYYPAEFFLENNFQQESNLHNLPQSFLQPKWVLMMALGGYGILLPLLARKAPGRHLVARLGATAPPAGLMPWFAAAIVLLLWYPLTFTGEWVEAFAGGLFLMSSGAAAPAWGVMLAASVALAAATTSISGGIEHGRDVHRTACTEREVQGLLADIAKGSAGGSDLWRMRRVHKRLWSAVREGYLDGDRLRTFNELVCAESLDQSSAVRRKYGIDPWGSAYWLEMERIDDDDHQVSLYSFGPNRRRDAADDIRASAIRRASPE